MNTVNMNIEIDPRDIIENLSMQDNETVMDMIIKLDLAMADWSFTRELIEKLVHSMLGNDQDKTKKVLSVFDNLEKGKQVARGILRNHGVILGRNYHQLSYNQVDKIVEAAKEYGYRKPKNANGSRARCFYEFANR